ncbi:MAG: hypothetical protein KC620_00265 [Myxococcales bacterium]|nr:hypothetical protein [Myxococcales bacterium]
MSFSALYLAGGRVRLTGAAWPEAWAPFATPAPADFAVDLHIEMAAAPTIALPVEPGGFSFRRHDLSFAIDADRRRAQARTDGSLGGLSAALELALQTALLPRGGLLVHAAGVVVDEAAWLLPGPSGAGKSTAARGGFARVLSDERVAVRREAGGWRAFGTPWWSGGQTSRLDAGSAPLAVLAELRWAERAATRTASPAAVAGRLMGAVALYETDEAAQRAAFEAALDLVEATRCVTLDFPREGRWASQLATA